MSAHYCESPVIWMTVARRYDRAHWFYKWNLLKFPKLNFVRVNGLDPINHHFRSTGNADTHGHAACWVTHYMAWQVGLATGHDHLFFVEDDVKMLDGFDEDMPAICSGEHHLLHLDPEATNGTYGYYVRRPILQRMVDEIQERTEHVDNQLWNRFGRAKHTRKLVHHGFDDLLSETCAHTWSTYHLNKV